MEGTLGSVEEGVLSGNGCGSPQEPAVQVPREETGPRRRYVSAPGWLPLRLQASGVSGLEERAHGEEDAQEDSLATDSLRY